VCEWGRTEEYVKLLSPIALFLYLQYGSAALACLMSVSPSVHMTKLRQILCTKYNREVLLFLDIP